MPKNLRSKELTVALATHKIAAAPSFRMDIPSANIFKHESYNANTRLNDIALLKLPYTITLKTRTIYKKSLPFVSMCIEMSALSESLVVSYFHF